MGAKVLLKWSSLALNQSNITLGSGGYSLWTKKNDKTQLENSVFVPVTVLLHQNDYKCQLRMTDDTGAIILVE